MKTAEDFIREMESSNVLKIGLMQKWRKMLLKQVVQISGLR